MSTIDTMSRPAEVILPPSWPENGSPWSGDAAAGFAKGSHGSLWERELDRDWTTRVERLRSTLNGAEAEVARIEEELAAIDLPSTPECPLHGAGCEAWS